MSIVWFILVGFLAQLVDGALGMAYGVSSTSILLSLGIHPAAASASVHTAEMFTTAVSGLSHWKLGNIDKALFRKLLVPGVIGGVVGAYILTAIPSSIVKPLISCYLLAMGLSLLWRTIRGVSARRDTKLVPLGLVGGFCDAMGGGGWGPIVTTTLVAQGNNPRFVIGSINAAEWFVTTAEVMMFVATIGLVHWQVIAGLMVGGVLAAPLAAMVCKRLPVKTLTLLVGIVITTLSIRTIYLALGG